MYNKLNKIGRIEEYEKKIGLNSDRKRYWHSELKSLKEKGFCDSSPIPIDLVDDIITKKEIEWVIDDMKDMSLKANSNFHIITLFNLWFTWRTISMSASENRIITRDIAIKLANSYMIQYRDLPKPPKGELFYPPRHNRLYALSYDVAKLHRHVIKIFPQCDNILDSPPSDEELGKMHDEKREHYVENTLRNIAIGFAETLDVDKSPSTTQLTVNVSQKNVQNLNNLVEVINSLSISTEDKKRVAELINEFDEEAKSDKNKEKLRSILLKVAEVSIDATSILLKHAHSMGILQHLLS